MRLIANTLIALTLIVTIVLFPSPGWSEASREPLATEGTRMDRINTIVSQRESMEKNASESTSSGLTQPPSGESTGLGLRMLEGLVLCTGLFFIGVAAYRKITGDRPMPRGRRMRLVERIVVAPKTSLVLATVDGREVLLAVGEKVSLMRLPTEEEYIDEMELVCQDVEEQPQQSVA